MARAVNVNARSGSGPEPLSSPLVSLNRRLTSRRRSTVDPESFDQIVARMATAPTRRSALKGMGLGILSTVGGTAAGLAAAIATDEEIAGAKGKGKKNRKGKNNKGRNNKGGGNTKGKNTNKNKGDGNRNSGGGGGGDVDAEKKGAGGKCKKGKNCVSGKCQGSKKKRRNHKGRCQQSDVGGRCKIDSDCIANSPCAGGICTFVS